MKSAPLGLAGCQEWSTSSRWRRLLAVETLSIDRSHDRTTCAAKIYARDRSRSISRWNTSGKPHVLLLDRTRQRTACTAFDSDARTKDNAYAHGLVMTGHNARRPRTGRERRRWWWPSEASYLTVWTLNDRFFASPVHCMLRRVLSEYWRKETEKSKVFLWGGRFGRSLLCQGRAEKETRGSWPTTGCLPVDRNQLGPDSWRDKKGVWYRTDRQTDRHTHGIKALWTARSPALAHTWHPARIKNMYLQTAP